MKLKEHLEHYIWLADIYLKERGLTRDDVTTGIEAWNVAHRAAITNHAYAVDRDIIDAHIQTVLEKVFPNAVFKDKKQY